MFEVRRCAGGPVVVPDPTWLNSGDNAWQLTAGTLVGLMSIPGLAILYGGAVQKRWAVNSAMMAFYGFAIVLIVWVLWGFKMGFGNPVRIGSNSSFLSNVVGQPGSVLGQLDEQARANIPLVSGIGAMPPFRFPQASLIYFQFVFAAITPLLILGSVLGRINFKAWMLFVPLWSTFVYSINAFLLWGGGWWSQQGAVDYSGGYVIHLAAGTSGFVAAAMIGPRLLRDREGQPDPNNLLMVMAGAGLLWLGWNGFNGGDPYFANADAAAAVMNTNLAAATAMLTWMTIDLLASGKPSLLGSVNGMITGLVAITPAAGFVNGEGAIAIGIAASAIPWFTLNKLGSRGIFGRVDDALGVVHTHGFAGLIGGLMVGLVADPKMIVYLGSAKTSAFSVGGLFYTGDGHQFRVQLGAGLTIIVFDAVMTFVILKLISLVVPLRLPDDVLEVGDGVIHGEELWVPLPHIVEPGHRTPIPAASNPATGSAFFSADVPGPHSQT
jgi:ammonium transporter, Amt family